MSNALEGMGVAITFQSGFFGFITDVEEDGPKREARETTNAATYNATSNVAWGTFIPSRIIKAGTLKVKIRYDPTKCKPPIDQPAETVTVTFPIPIGGNTASSVACSGFLTEAGRKTPVENLIEQDLTIQFSGLPTWTAGT